MAKSTIMYILYRKKPDGTQIELDRSVNIKYLADQLTINWLLFVDDEVYITRI
jgi:hypothetical protein